MTALPGWFSETNMTPITLLKYPISSPSDDTALHKLKEHGVWCIRHHGSGWKDWRHALIYRIWKCWVFPDNKIGNGCVNDFSRTLSALVWESKIPSSAVTVFSGGTEGVLCPHVTFIVGEKFKRLITNTAQKVFVFTRTAQTFQLITGTAHLRLEIVITWPSLNIFKWN